MHSGRQNYVTMSPPPKDSNQIRVGVGHDSHGVSRRGARDHSPRVNRRSLSPHGRDMIRSSRRASLGEGKSASNERKDNNWHVGVSRAGKIQSGLPMYFQECKMPRRDERIAHRKHEYTDDIHYDDGRTDRLDQVYGYVHPVAPARINIDRDYFEKGIDGLGMIGQKKLIPIEEGLMRGAHHMVPDFVAPSNYRETSEHLTVPLRHMDIEQFEDVKLGHRESIPLEKRRAIEIYKEGEKPIFHSSNASYTRTPVSHHNDFGSSSHFKNIAGTSSGVSMGDFSYQESVPLRTCNEYPRGSVKLSEPVDYNIHGQKLGSNARDFDNDKRILRCYEQGSYSPTRTEHDVYPYTDSQRIYDDYGYPLNDLERTPAHTQLVHVQSRMDDEHRELRRTITRHPAMDDFNLIDETYGDMTKTWEHPTTEKQKAIENLETERISYLGHSRVEFGRRTVLDDEASRLGVLQDHAISHVRSNHGFGRDSGPRFHEERFQGPRFQEERLQSPRFQEERLQDPILHEERLHGPIFQEERLQAPRFQKERLQDPHMPVYDAEMQRHAVKRQRMREEDALYDSSHKGFNRKYLTEEDMIRHDKRTIAPSAWNEPKEFVDPYETGEEWIGKDTFGLHATRNQRFDHHAYRKAKRTLNGRGHAVNVASENWLHSQDSVPQTRRNLVSKPIKNTKGHPKSYTLGYYKSNQIDTSRIHRHNRTWKTNDDCDEDVHANDDNPSKEWMEPPEESEEFKQLVEEAFLLYSIQLNLNSAVRRRYKEQGKAGNLFCIVCGRSTSKEFMDTQRLVTHAFMSHKVGLRARHLGLHKAICVLMGWNSYVPCATVTWVPDVLPSEEALAQKEDLMLWPPLVVIHNISMTNNNPERQKVVPLEGVEAFLRGKGFESGKIKVCLGKPADQSVMLVKFLGTFTGLANAERLHKYFVENKRGREEFERKTSNNGKRSNSWEDEVREGEKLEEQLLYGYMGIADDLDRLDFHTKKWINIKSKKEIQDIANAPVKTDDK